jgi:PPM family protein phosphatase
VTDPTTDPTTDPLPVTGPPACPNPACDEVPDPAAGPGALLLCTDGLWNYLPGPDELAAAALGPLARSGPTAAAAALTELALQAGGRDNITIVLVPLP